MDSLSPNSMTGLVGSPDAVPAVRHTAIAVQPLESEASASLSAAEMRAYLKSKQKRKRMTRDERIKRGRLSCLGRVKKASKLIMFVAFASLVLLVLLRGAEWVETFVWGNGAPKSWPEVWEAAHRPDALNFVVLGDWGDETNPEQRQVAQVGRGVFLDGSFNASLYPLAP